MDLDNEELKATKEKTADEMFEELGYKKAEHIYPTLGFVVEYDNGERQIDFMNEEEEVKIWNISTTMQELKAINKKCEEMGWI